MTTSDRSLSLLNIFEIVDGQENRHLLCFLDPILAGSAGIDQRSVLGDFIPGPDLSFNRDTFRLNPVFIESFTQFMNEVAAQAPELQNEAKTKPSDWIYLLDPRCEIEEDEEPRPSDLLGCFAVDDSGQIVPKSFLYNEKHDWFDPESGLSGVLQDRKFYDWLHRGPGSKGL